MAREFPPHPRQTLLDRLLLASVRDEDGRRVKHLRAEKRRKVIRRWDRRKEFGGARWRATPAWAKWMLGTPVGVFLMLVIAAFALRVVSNVWGVEYGGWVGVVLGWGLPLSILGVIVTGLAMMLVDDRAATRAMLSMRVCVGCFYDLRGIPERESGVVVCPECGSAWRVEAGQEERCEA